MFITLPRQLFLFLAFGISSLVYGQSPVALDIKSISSFDEWAQWVEKVRTESPDSAIDLYELSFQHFLDRKDTLQAVQSLVGMAAIHGHMARYQSSYDNLWKALLLADLAKSDQGKISVYISLGRYYSFYKRKEKALDYFQQALALNKKLVAQGELPEESLVDCYYPFSSTFRELLNPEQAKVYLDSSLLYHNPQHQAAINGFLRFEAAFILGKGGKFEPALDSMATLESWLEERNPGYLVLLYTYMGDLYVGMEDLTQAEVYYEKALKVSEIYHSHFDFTPTIHERLATLYVERNSFQKAYESLEKVKELDAQYFDSRSENSRSLLEIKDAYRLEKEKQRQYVQQQRLLELEHDERISFLRNTLLTVSLVFLVLVGIIYFQYLRNKHRAEKLLIQRKKELDIQQAQELLELKNRELAASSLKLIEKDGFLAELKEKLSGGNGELKSEDLKRIVRTISHSSVQNWEEFEARFISVNKQFYEKLNARYPKLTRGDQKLCALIKLNLSSKEMAQLLGISIESVHTSRYRLRKKLNLAKEVSLTEFITKF